MTKLFLISVAVVLLMLICSLIASIHDVNKRHDNVHKEIDRINGGDSTNSSPKQYGMHLLQSGKWRINRIRNKQLKH